MYLKKTVIVSFKCYKLFKFSFIFSLNWVNPSVNYLTLRNFFCNQIVIGATRPANRSYIVADVNKIAQ